jgi:mannose-1-phosphate guanylyltransferase/phosphomannomutase
MARMAEVEKEAGPAIFRQSEMIYGGLLAVVGLLDYLADTGYSVAEMVDESPLGEWVHLRVPCPWEMKGRVMRLLLEERSAGEEPVTGGGAGGEARGETSGEIRAGELQRYVPAAATTGSSTASGPVEGMQAESGEGRVLVLPDGERPAFHIYSEAASMEIAEELAAFYSKRVKELAGLEEGRPGE